MHADEDRTGGDWRPRVRGHAGGLPHQEHHFDLRGRSDGTPGPELGAALQGEAAVLSGG